MSEKMKPRAYVESKRHLPQPIRDFHDCKDVFKLIERLQGRFKSPVGAELSWVDAQIYVIDHFLWFMAQRGWTLQRSRADVEFRDLAEEIKAMQNEDAEAFRKAIAERNTLVAAPENPQPPPKASVTR